MRFSPIPLMDANHTIAAINRSKASRTKKPISFNQYTLRRIQNVINISVDNREEKHLARRTNESNNCASACKSREVRRLCNKRVSELWRMVERTWTWRGVAVSSNLTRNECGKPWNFLCVLCNCCFFVWGAFFSWTLC